MTNKKLRKAYAKRFEHLNTLLFNDKAVVLQLFVEYLRYLRDFYVTASEGESSASTLVTLMAAITEFDAYMLDGDDKQFHWESFWNTVKQNMEEWVAFNDSV